MSRPPVSLRPTLILLAFAVMTLPLAAAAQDDEPRGASFELFGGPSAVYTSTSGLTLHNETFGARGGFHLTRVWTVEAELSRSSHDRPSWNGEVSAKAYLIQADRFRLFGLAGPGVQHEDAAGRSSDTGTVHAGIGAEIALAARTYLRPEVRARWPVDHLSGRNHSLDYTLGFGWRF